MAVRLTNQYIQLVLVLQTLWKWVTRNVIPIPSKGPLVYSCRGTAFPLPTGCSPGCHSTLLTTFINEASQVFPQSHTLSLGVGPLERHHPHQMPTNVWKCPFESGVKNHHVCCMQTEYLEFRRLLNWFSISKQATGSLAVHQSHRALHPGGENTFFLCEPGVMELAPYHRLTGSGPLCFNKNFLELARA